MLRTEIIAVCSEILAEHRSTLCGQIGKILNIKFLKPTGYLMHQQVQN